MSDSELPDDDNIEQCLRRIVRDALKQDEEVTANSARSRTETQLGLEAGFFKGDEAWKKRSKEIIAAAVEDPLSPVKVKATVKAKVEKKSVATVKSKPVAKAGNKRKSDEDHDGRKRMRKVEVAGTSDVEDLEAEETQGRQVTGPRMSKRKAAIVDDDDEVDDGDDGDEEDNNHDFMHNPRRSKSEEDGVLSEATDDADGGLRSKLNGKPTPLDDDNNDDSDLSSLLDDPPPKKKRSRQRKPDPASSPGAKQPPPKSKSSRAATSEDLPPSEAEIKRLQSWLLKCGIRKLWHRKLAPFPTDKAKIAHLKGILDDVGLTGSYSVEKARKIKERRELQAELEGVREFDQQWGRKKGEDGGDDIGEEEGPVVRRGPRHRSSYH